VVVLLLFAVMLTRAPIGPSPDLDRPALPAALIGGGVGFGLTLLLADAFHWTRYELPPPGTARRVGEQIFGAWVLPFEVLSILLLAALVGAIVLSRPDLGARPDPEAAAQPVPPPDPVDESAEVVARLERIAARQAAAQARVRRAHDEKMAAEALASADAEGPPTDPLRERARDLIFGAQGARPRLGEPDPSPDPAGPQVIEGTAEPARTRAIDGAGKPDGPRAIEGSDRPGGRRAIEGTGKPAVSGPEERRAVGGRGDRPALPSKPTAEDEETEA
jgi:hypothetical protein